MIGDLSSRFQARDALQDEVYRVENVEHFLRLHHQALRVGSLELRQLLYENHL